MAVDAGGVPRRSPTAIAPEFAQALILRRAHDGAGRRSTAGRPRPDRARVRAHAPARRRRARGDRGRSRAERRSISQRRGWQPVGTTTAPDEETRARRMRARDDAARSRRDGASVARAERSSRARPAHLRLRGEAQCCRKTLTRLVLRLRRWIAPRRSVSRAAHGLVGPDAPLSRARRPRRPLAHARRATGSTACAS